MNSDAEQVVFDVLGQNDEQLKNESRGCIAACGIARRAPSHYQRILIHSTMQAAAAAAAAELERARSHDADSCARHTKKRKLSNS